MPDLPAGSSAPLNGVKPPALRADSELPRQIYRRAYEQTRKEMTPTNARARLEQLDGQIEREKDLMR